MSTPNAAGDPCPQTGTDCATLGKPAYAVCTSEGQWGQCMCMGSGCGNGTIESPEQCDGINLNGADCSIMGAGSTGTLMCDPVACTYDMSLCMAPSQGTSGTSGGGTGG
ncbi:MAG TPA: hypothetical protein VHM19_11745 [Polyangiales bacterium]|nr:hypothetical protein [Polyangiales bacterium]